MIEYLKFLRTIIFPLAIPGESDLEHDFEECTGYLEEIRLDSDDNGPVMVVRFWTKIVQHYTRVKTLFAGLIDILFKQLKVQLRTDTCTTGDHKFESYEVLSKYIP